MEDSNDTIRESTLGHLEIREVSSGSPAITFGDNMELTNIEVSAGILELAFAGETKLLREKMEELHGEIDTCQQALFFSMCVYLAAYKGHEELLRYLFGGEFMPALELASPAPNMHSIVSTGTFSGFSMACARGHAKCATMLFNELKRFYRYRRNHLGEEGSLIDGSQLFDQTFPHYFYNDRWAFFAHHAPHEDRLEHAATDTIFENIPFTNLTMTLFLQVGDIPQGAMKLTAAFGACASLYCGHVAVFLELMDVFAEPIPPREGETKKDSIELSKNMSTKTLLAYALANSSDECVRTVYEKLSASEDDMQGAIEVAEEIKFANARCVPERLYKLFGFSTWNRTDEEEKDTAHEPLA